MGYIMELVLVTLTTLTLLGLQFAFEGSAEWIFLADFVAQNESSADLGQTHCSLWVQVAYHAVQNLHLVYLGQFFTLISSLLECFVEILILLILSICTLFFSKMFNWKLMFLSDSAQENDLLIGPSFDKINWFQLQMAS